MCPAKQATLLIVFSELLLLVLGGGGRVVFRHGRGVVFCRGGSGGGCGAGEREVSRTRGACDSSLLQRTLDKNSD